MDLCFTLSQGQIALAGSLFCDQGKTNLSHATICDDEYKCEDKADESFCSCENHLVLWKCQTNNMCVMARYVCDSECDCQDCTDEDEEFCKKYPSGFNTECPPGFIELKGKFLKKVKKSTRR